MRSMQWQLGILGTISAFAYRHRETKKNLCRGGRSQDLPNTDFQPAVRHLKLQCPVEFHKDFYFQGFITDEEDKYQLYMAFRFWIILFSEIFDAVSRTSVSLEIRVRCSFGISVASHPVTHSHIPEHRNFPTRRREKSDTCRFRSFLVAFEKLRKSTNSFVTTAFMSVRLSLRPRAIALH